MGEESMSTDRRVCEVCKGSGIMHDSPFIPCSLCRNEEYINQLRLIFGDDLVLPYLSSPFQLQRMVNTLCQSKIKTTLIPDRDSVSDEITNVTLKDLGF